MGKVAPKAENVAIAGIIKFGKTLTAEYKYTDDNDDPEDLKEDKENTAFRWLVSDTPDGKYIALSEQSKTIVVDKRFTDKYIKVEVTPVSKEEPKVGEPKVSESVYMGIFTPVVTKAEITRDGNVLTAKYEADDKNKEDSIEDVKYQWYLSNEKDGEYTPVEEAESSQYIIDETNYNKYILVEITAVSNNEPKNSKPLKAQCIAAPFKPAAFDLEISGEVKEGQTVGAEYEFYDENGDKEHGSIITWYLGGSWAGTGASFEIPFKASGKEIYYTVLSMTEEIPQEGELVESKRIRVATEVTFAGGRGNSGGGGGGTYVPPKKEEEIKPEENNPTETTSEQGIFKDMENHWAKNEVEKLYEKGIITGVTKDKFKPDDKITRAQTAVILARALKLADGDGDFLDVAYDSWYYDAVSKVQSAGLFMGNQGSFRPMDNIIRQEMACVIKKEEKFNPTAELSVSDAALMAMYAVGYNIMYDDSSAMNFADDKEEITIQRGVIIGVGYSSLHEEGNVKDGYIEINRGRFLYDNDMPV